MRKMSKGAAITGGIFCIISLLFSLIGLLINIANYSRMGISDMIPSLLTSNIPGFLVFILLAIVLFRRRADVFAGVIFILLGIYALGSTVGNVLAISSYRVAGLSPTTLFFAIAGNLIRGVMYILMAVHCFRKNAGKTPLYGIGFIVVGLISAVQSISQFASNGIFSYNPGAAVISLIPVVLGAVIGALPLILAGFAVGGAKAAAPVNPADPYGLYAQYGMQPPVSAPNSQSVIDSFQAQYQTPQQAQYQAPQQAWQQPQYQTPQQQAWQPQYQTPQQQAWQSQYQAPQQQAWQPQQQAWQSQYQAPQQETWQQPQYQAPQQPDEKPEQ